MKASVNTHAVAVEGGNPESVAVARLVGQAVASAPMADNSINIAWYALKAVKSAGKSAKAEIEWQNSKMPPELAERIWNAREMRRV